MHVVDGLAELVHVALDGGLRQVVFAASDPFVEIHVHQLAHNVQRLGFCVTGAY